MSDKNCPWCGCKPKPDPDGKHRWGCGSFLRGTEPWQSEGCQLNEADNRIDELESALDTADSQNQHALDTIEKHEEMIRELNERAIDAESALATTHGKCKLWNDHANELSLELATAKKELKDRDEESIEACNAINSYNANLAAMTKQRDEAKEKLAKMIETINAHEIVSLSCDRDGESYCECLSVLARQEPPNAPTP